MWQKLLGSFIITLFLAESFFIYPNVNFSEIQDCKDSVILEQEFIPDNVNKLLANAPLAFTENRGQLDNDEVRFYDQGGAVWFTDDGVWFELRDYAESQGRGSGIKDQGDSNPLKGFEPPVPVKYKRVVLKQEFVGANQVKPVGKERLDWNSNFFYGNDSSMWYTEVPNYSEVYYENLYDGIDLRYYTNEKGLKYDFILHSRTDVSQIRIRYDGAEKLLIDESGNLIIKTKFEDIMDGELFIYQNQKDDINEIDGRFVKFNTFEYGFKIFDNYRKQDPLIIDPLMNLEYSTFIGGSDRDRGFDIEIDDTGCAFITGSTYSSDFPTTPGVYNRSFKGIWDIFIVKINQQGSNLIYSTFVGGADEDECFAIAIDTKGNAYTTGTTRSQNFPTTAGAFDPSYNSPYPGFWGDVFALKLNHNGSMLNYSTFLGGTDSEYARGIAVDSKGNAYLTGWTNSLNFPITNSAYDTVLNNTDIYITKLNEAGSGLYYSTFVGGNNNDKAEDITIDSTGDAFVTGVTGSSDFPTTPKAYNKSYNGGIFDCFVLKINSKGSVLKFSTLLGGNDYDSGLSIVVDSIGNIYVTGRTDSSNFPTTKGAFDRLLNGTSDAFAIKLNKSGSKLIFSTLIGGNNFEVGIGIDIDLNGNINVIGYTYSIDFPTTSDTFDKLLNGTIDVFLLKLDSNAKQLLYSTYFGGDGYEVLFCIKHGPLGYTYLIGYTNSDDFPTTPGAFNNKFNGNEDVFVTKVTFGPIFRISSLSLLINSKPTNLIYSRFSPYTFRVNVTDTISLNDLELVRLNIDPLGTNIQLLWNRISNQFTKLSDLNNYITLDQSSVAFNDSCNVWTINFNVTFNWNYPDENFHDIQAYATNASFFSTWYNATEFYRVENDLVFNGSLSVTGDNNRTIGDGELVRGSEKLNWTGLTVVYENTTNIHPPADEFNVTIWDEAGNSWIDSPLPGENFTIDAPVDPATDLDGNIHIINLSGIPPECDATNETFTIRIDSDNVTFSNPIPDINIWQTTFDVEVGINISDIGGGFVNGSSVKYSFSTDNGINWSEWIGFPELKSGVSVNPQDVVFFPEGINNHVKWQAEDSVGNGPVESEEYRILVDTEELFFSNGYPTEKNESPTKNVEVGITISDVTSGVDALSVEYAISTNNGATWGSWVPVTEIKDEMNINVSLNLTFPNGTGNRIKWRASDVAGNGPTESKVYVVIVNTWLLEWSIPKVKLWTPPNGSIISSTVLELSWRLVNRDLLNVTYDVYLDTLKPPVKINHSGIINTTIIIDNLSNGVTYYWTVIPKIEKINGSCESGVWSFTIIIPIPKINLFSPENNSIINDFQPRLSWSVEYDGTEILSYNVYFGTSEDPELEFKDHPSTNCFIKERLTDGETYYWKIVPCAGNIQGPASETWSFTIKKDYIPYFELELFVLPPIVELQPGDIKRVRAIVRNLGELEDSILLRVEVPSDLGVGAIVNEPCIISTIPMAIAEFYITVTTSMDPQNDEINLTVVAVSRRATEYDLIVEEKEELTLKILSQEKKDEDEPWLSISEFWIIFLIIIVILITLIIVLIVLRQKKSSQETKEETTAEEALTVRPGTVPKAVISVGETPPTITPPQLPEATVATESQQQTMAISKVPTLASSTTPGQVPKTQRIPQVAQVPQLPSAQPETEETIEESKEETTPELDKPMESQQETDQNPQEKD